MENNKKTILISISSAILVRNFFAIPGGFLEQLKQRGNKVIALVPKGAYKRVKEDFGGNNVIIEPIEISSVPQKFLQRAHRFFSTYLIFTEGARLFASMGVRIDVPVAGGKRFLYPTKIFIVGTFGKIRWVKRWLTPKLDSLVYPERPFKRIFDEHKPDIVFLPNVHHNQDVTVLREAKRQKVKTIGMPGSWDHFPKRFEPLRVDRLMVWNEPVKKEALDLQEYNDKNTFITGSPQFDVFVRKDLLMSREEFLEKYGLDRNKKIIFFGSSGTYSPDDGDIVDIILKAIRENKLKADSQIFFRPYPGETTDHEKFDKFRDHPLVCVNWIEPEGLFADPWYPNVQAVIDFLNIMHHSDIIINTYSSIGLESSAFLKPTINIGFDGYKDRPFAQSLKRFKHLSHYKYVLETKGVKTVESEEDLLGAINDFLVNPESNKENSIKLRDKMCWKVDGGASKRIVGHILDYLNE